MESAVELQAPAKGAGTGGIQARSNIPLIFKGKIKTEEKKEIY
jgi:hypothetical protein